MEPDYVHAEDYSLTVEEMRELRPWATEFVRLDGRLCWDTGEIEAGQG
jgi:hypothetical protein